MPDMRDELNGIAGCICDFIRTECAHLYSCVRKLCPCFVLPAASVALYAIFAGQLTIRWLGGVAISMLLVLLCVWFVHRHCGGSYDPRSEGRRAQGPRHCLRTDPDLEAKALLSQFDYWIDRQRALNTWRDAILLAFIGAYAALAVTVVGKFGAIRDLFVSSSPENRWVLIAALVLVIASSIGFLILRRLAIDRAHNSRSLNALEGVTGYMEAASGHRLPVMLPNGMAVPLSAGGQVTSDTIVMALNALPLTVGALLYHAGTAVPSAGSLVDMLSDPWRLLAMWALAVLLQMFWYSVWACSGNWVYPSRERARKSRA